MIPRERFSDHRGRLLVEVDLAKLWNGVGPCLALHRADLHAVLIDGAREVPIRMGVGCAGSPSTTGPSRSSSARNAGEYDLAVGADGIHSTMRRLAFGDQASARPVGQVGWRFVAACPSEITTWTVMLGHRAAFLMLPIGHGRVYCYCDVASASGEDGGEDFGRFFSGFAEPALGLIDSVPDQGLLHRSTIEEVALDSSVNGRVILVGDAGHATSPNMAEGAGMALEDALVLADCLKRHEMSPPHWRTTRPVAGLERTGSGHRRTAAIEPATSRPPRETRCCARLAQNSPIQLPTATRSDLADRREGRTRPGR